MMKMLGKTGCFTQEENQILYQIFCSSVQEKKKAGDCIGKYPISGRSRKSNTRYLS